MVYDRPIDGCRMRIQKEMLWRTPALAGGYAEIWKSCGWMDEVGRYVSTVVSSKRSYLFYRLWSHLKVHDLSGGEGELTYVKIK